MSDAASFLFYFSEVLLPVKPLYSSLCLRIRVPEDPTNTETLLSWYEKQKTFHYFTCISLITDTNEYLPLLSSEISSFVNWLFMFFSHFSYWVIVFLLSVCINYWYMNDISPLCHWFLMYRSSTLCSQMIIDYFVIFIFALMPECTFHSRDQHLQFLPIN